MSKSNLTAAERRNIVAKRAFGCCEYCLSQAKFSPDPFAIEHIMPLATIDRLQLNREGVVNLVTPSTIASACYPK
jgi:hypothetical protein